MKFHDDGIIIARSHRCDLGSCNPESIEQRQIDDFQDLTSVILKVINLALFLSDEAKFQEADFSWEQRHVPRHVPNCM